jgi:hypothetical protein
MHIEIKKFYESQRDTMAVEQDDSGRFYFQSLKRSGMGFIVAEIIDDEIKYCHKGKLYSEEEMLRIIKLKAFL